MTYMAFNDIELDLVTTSRRTQRVQRAQFGDGYSQILTDGLNSEGEVWDCTTIALTNEEIFSLESYFLAQRGQAIPWTSPFDTKTFSRPFEAGQLRLGYTNIGSLTLTGYTRPTDYTANMVTGLLTSVTIANSTVVPIVLTLASRSFLINNGWTITPVGAVHSTLKFSLTRVYV